jgi:hypothetical protein
MIQVSLLCDDCGRLLGTGNTATDARRYAQPHRPIRGRVLCNWCCVKNGYKPKEPPRGGPKP